MTPDQVAIVQTVLVGIQTILGFVAIVLAIREVPKWRTELLGSRKIDLAIKLGLLARSVKAVFNSGRGAWGQTAPEYKPDSTEDEKWKQNREYDFNQRLRLIQDKLEPLNELVWEMSSLFEDYEVLEKLVGQYNRKLDELRIAMQMTTWGQSRPEFIDIIWGGYQQDSAFGKEIDGITAKLEEFAHEHINPHKNKTPRF